MHGTHLRMHSTMTDHNILLTIITVGLNDHEIAATLNPLTQSLSCSSVESIIVTPSPSDSLRNSFPSSTFVADPKTGVYFAMNEGLRIATGFYVWFLNAGDESLLDDVSIQYMLEDLRKRLIRCSVQNFPLVLFGFGYSPFADAFCLRILFKFSLFTLGMPVSHQNILFARSLHNPFSNQYRYSSDYEILSNFVIKSRSRILFASSRPIAKLVAGGISDINRLTVFQERYAILMRLVNVSYTPIVATSFLVRVLREFSASTIKLLIGWR